MKTLEQLEDRDSPSFHLSESRAVPIEISDLCRNLVALFRPVGAGKFGKLAPLKLLAVSQCCGFVS
jgi:hypothetical protein